MEGIIAVILVFFAWILIRLLLSAGARTVTAAARSATGKGSLSENMELAFRGMGDLTVRFKDTTLGEDDSGPLAKLVEAKGLFPLTKTKQIGFVTSVFDKTGGELEPVISVIETFQEPASVAYQHTVEVGKVSPDQGFASWVKVGVVCPEILLTPFGGDRKLIAVVRMVDSDKPPRILNGYHDKDDPGLLWQRSIEFDFHVSVKGYKEAATHRDEARALSITIAMAVAMADGSLNYTEGRVLQDWISRAISPFAGEKRDSLKQLYNGAMKEAYAAAKAGNLSLSRLTERLNEVGEKSIKYEAIELCFDVMAADGKADPEEMKTIRKVAAALELDYNEMENIRDQRIIGLTASVAGQSSVEDILGIESDWDRERIKAQLRTEFNKWNNRIGTLPEGAERENAQSMIDLVAEARKKYG